MSEREKKRGKVFSKQDERESKGFSIALLLGLIVIVFGICVRVGDIIGMGVFLFLASSQIGCFIARFLK